MPDDKMIYRSVMLTDVGRVRKLNEDAVLSRPDIGLWVVADGMGGHDAGDYASNSIVRALGALPDPADGVSFLNEVSASLMAVNHALLDKAEESDQPKTIGSTVVALLMFDGHYACLWVGDSRAYRFRGGALEQISRDHSLVQQLLDAKLISAEEAENHPQSNVITRAVGASRDLEIEARQGAVEPGDLFLLCSDGLNRMITDDEIGAVLRAEAPANAAARLMRMSLDRGARDNVSLILVEAAAAATASDEDDTLKSYRR